MDSIQSGDPVKDGRLIVLVAARTFAVVRSRLALIDEMLSRGWTVHVVAKEDRYAEELDRRSGVTRSDLDFPSGGISLFHSMKAVIKLRKIFASLRPELVHFFNARPTLCGLLACRTVGSPITSIVTVTGLGHAFEASRMIRAAASIGYALLLKKTARTVFQNPEDLEYFVSAGLISRSRGELVIGSGVNTQEFTPRRAHTQSTEFSVLMASRLLRSKGVGEFISAAQYCRQDWPDARFILVGEAQRDHPDAYPLSEIISASQNGTIDFLGYRDDLSRLIGQVDLVVLPSYYREGVPRILQEAAACGVPCITTDTPGCREAVVDGITGYLVPARSAKALADGVKKFLQDRGLSIAMGRAARQFACEKFDVQKIAQAYLSIYKDVLKNA